jgi:hypothetical protein
MLYKVDQSFKALHPILQASFYQAAVVAAHSFGGGQYIVHFVHFVHCGIMYFVQYHNRCVVIERMYDQRIECFDYAFQSRVSLHWYGFVVDVYVLRHEYTITYRLPFTTISSSSFNTSKVSGHDDKV